MTLCNCKETETRGGVWGYLVRRKLLFHIIIGGYLVRDACLSHVLPQTLQIASVLQGSHARKIELEHKSEPRRDR